MAKKSLPKKQTGGDLKKAMADSSVARRYIKANKSSGNMTADVFDKKLALMHKPYEIRKAANDSAGVKTPPYKDISKGSYWNKKTGGQIKTKKKK